MAKSYKKTIVCKCVLPEELHKKFLYKTKSEGWCIQEVLFALIRDYTEGLLDFEGNE